MITALTLFAASSAMLTVRAEYLGPPRDVYIFKPLTVVLIILIALDAKNPASQFYRYAIIAGLVCSLAGDVFLMLPSDKFIHGLSSFLVAHVCYIAAFVSEGGREVCWPCAIPFLVYGGGMLRLLWPHLGKMKTPVLIYMFVILLMAWAAVSRWRMTAQSGSLLAMTGALLFCASDSILAVNRFKGRFSSAQLLILSTYFVAQWLIALST